MRILAGRRLAIVLLLRRTRIKTNPKELLITYSNAYGAV